MRVVAGTAKSLPLKSVTGTDVRPTTDRIKETLFNIIQPYMTGCRFLDLFSGSGAIGIEALSRGADLCVFMDKYSKAIGCLRENLTFTKLAARAQIIQGDIPGILGQMKGKDPFDYIFMDPPYHQHLEKEVLEYCMNASFVSEHTIFIVEASLDTSFDYLKSYGYSIIKQKKYKTNTHIFLQRCEGVQEDRV